MKALRLRGELTKCVCTSWADSQPTWVPRQSPHSMTSNSPANSPACKSPPNSEWLKRCHSLLDPWETTPNACGLNVSLPIPQAEFHVPTPGMGRAIPMKTMLLPTLTDSGLVTMTEVLWKTLTRTTGPYFLALETKVTQRRLSTTGNMNTTSPGPAGETGHPIPGGGSPRAWG